MMASGDNDLIILFNPAYNVINGKWNDIHGKVDNVRLKVSSDFFICNTLNPEVKKQFLRYPNLHLKKIDSLFCHIITVVYEVQ